MPDRNDIEKARRYVAEFSVRVDEQKRWIRVLLDRGLPTATAESLLIAFESSLALAKEFLNILSEGRESPTDLPAGKAPPDLQPSADRPHPGADNSLRREKKSAAGVRQTAATRGKRSGGRGTGRSRRAR